jgi:hypothetical protein
MSQPLFDEPGEQTQADYIRILPADIVGHTLLVWAVDYIEHSPTQFSRADKPSDVIVVDLVDLDLFDPDTNEAGYLAQGQWWRQGRLIQVLKPKIGSARPILGRMDRGVAAQGFAAPFVLTSMSTDPVAVGRANVWLASHPDFKPSTPKADSFQDPWEQQPQPPPPRQSAAARPSRPLQQAQQQTSSLMDRLRAQAERNRAQQLPPPPDQPGF